MKSLTEASINEAVNSELPVEAVAAKLLSEEFKAGETATLLDDPTYAINGVKVKVKGPSSKGSGYLDVELPNGTVIQAMSSLLQKAA